jgi:excisionase family DNA binding protein
MGSLKAKQTHGVVDPTTPTNRVFERPPCPKKGDDVENRDRLLTPGEVANLFRVDPKTVTRWAASGRIGSIRTPGGHRRFRESEVRALLRGDSEVDSASSLTLEASDS